jgi:hypothetical protein
MNMSGKTGKKERANVSVCIHALCMYGISAVSNAAAFILVFSPQLKIIGS